MNWEECSHDYEGEIQIRGVKDCTPFGSLIGVFLFLVSFSWKIDAGREIICCGVCASSYVSSARSYVAAGLFLKRSVYIGE